MLDWVCTEEWLPLPPHPPLIPFPRAASRGLVTTTYKVVTPKGASGSCHLYMQHAPTRGGNVTTLPPIHANVATGMGGRRWQAATSTCGLPTGEESTEDMRRLYMRMPFPDEGRGGRWRVATYPCDAPTGECGVPPPIHATPRQDRKSRTTRGGESRRREP